MYENKKEQIVETAKVEPKKKKKKKKKKILQKQQMMFQHLSRKLKLSAKLVEVLLMKSSVLSVRNLDPQKDVLKDTQNVCQKCFAMILESHWHMGTRKLLL